MITWEEYHDVIFVNYEMETLEFFERYVDDPAIGKNRNGFLEGIERCKRNLLKLTGNERGFLETAKKSVVVQAPNEKAERGEAKLWWKKEGDDDTGYYYVCPKCQGTFELETGGPRENNYNHCPSCGLRLLPPMEEEEL